MPPRETLLPPRLGLIIAAIGLAVVFRLIPHPPNFAPIAAIGLFGGAYLANRWMALAIPLAALFLSDLVLGLHSGMWAVYAAMAVSVLLGGWLRSNRAPHRVVGAALAGSLVFFALTNLAVWLMDGMYPMTLGGLAACYMAALPFLQNTVVGDLVFTVALFGGFALLERRFPVLRAEPRVAAA